MMTFQVTDEPTLKPQYPEAQNLLQYLFHHLNHPEKLFRLKDLLTMTNSLFYASKLLKTLRNKVSQYSKMRQL